MRAVTAFAIATAAILAALVPLTAAAEITLGANVGSARVNESDFEGDNTGWKAHAGYNFNHVIGAEIGYADFGPYQRDPNQVEESDADAWTAAMTLGVPVGLANLYAKGGVAGTEMEGSSVREESSNTDPFYGVGLRIGVTPGLGFRAEYERYQFEDFDLDMAQAGLEFRFGARRQ